MFNYDLNRTLEALLFICEHLEGTTKHQLSKLLYFADKYHLVKYGRTVTGDKYVKMEFGPVPSQTYDHIRNSAFIDDIFAINGYHVSGKRAANTDELSASDVEALNYALNEFGTMSFGKLTDISHDASWSAADDNAVISLDQFLLTYDAETQKEIKTYLSS